MQPVIINVLAGRSMLKIKNRLKSLTSSRQYL